MPIPSWAAPGVLCVCIDQNWINPFTNEEVMGPEKGDRCTITEATTLDVATYIRLAEWGGDWFELAAFRPLTRWEQDAIMFASIVDDAINGIDEVVQVAA